MAARRARDSRLLDAIERLPVTSYAGVAWRIVGNGRDPLQCSAAGGRWDDRTFGVLYTSTQADGAFAEMYFHLGKGQPVIPSLLRYRLFEFRVTLEDCVDIGSVDELGALGLATAAFGKLSYADRGKEYPRTQEIAEAAHFHDRRGLLVPSARSEHRNLVIFCEKLGPAAVEVVKDHGLVSWSRLTGEGRTRLT
jgi:RES domain-containing protein